MSATITLAIKNGKYVHVSTFKQNVGLDCGCICPKCGERLGSRIFSQKSKKESCYFHENEISSCSGGQKESELHLLAKQVFEKNTWLINPPFETKGELKFQYTQVEFENKIGNIRPDIVLTNGKGDKLLIEVAVTSFVKDKSKKAKEIERLEVPTIEVNLKELYVRSVKIDSLVESELQLLLIDTTKKKRWIWNEVNHVERSYEEQEPKNHLWKHVFFFVAGAVSLFAIIKTVTKECFQQKKVRKLRRIRSSKRF